MPAPFMRGPRRRGPRPARRSPYDGTLKPNPGPRGWREHRECRTVIDVGAGVRPMQWYRPSHHLCVEPYGPYADILEQHGYEVERGTALAVLPAARADAVYMLDVIEHMEKAEALEVIALAQASALAQVVVYTPLGFMPQEHDNWGLGGEHWQTHRSGWTPEEFQGWKILPHGRRGFYALWTHATRN